MPEPISLSEARTAQALQRVLAAKGYEPRDFVVGEQTGTGLGELLGVMGGLLSVRCRSTGEERMYSTGMGSAWLGAFLSDLSSGHFQAAARRRTLPVDALLQGRYETTDRSQSFGLRQ